MAEFKIEVNGPPGQVEELLDELQPIADEYEFSLEPQGIADGRMSSVEMILASVQTAVSLAALIIQIVGFRQNYDKTSPPEAGELHIYIHHVSGSQEIVNSDPATIEAAQRMLEQDDARPDAT